MEGRKSQGGGGLSHINAAGAGGASLSCPRARCERLPAQSLNETQSQRERRFPQREPPNVVTSFVPIPSGSGEEDDFDARCAARWQQRGGRISGACPKTQGKAESTHWLTFPEVVHRKKIAFSNIILDFLANSSNLT